MNEKAISTSRVLLENPYEVAELILRLANDIKECETEISNIKGRNFF
jgi:hypothetical protein